MKQMGFDFLKSYRKEFGGSLLQGKRKERRPLSTRHPIHLILKSCEKGVFAPTNRSLQNLINQMASRFRIKIFEYAVNWSHIHLVIQIQRREDYNAFIRALASILAQRLKKARGLQKVFTLRPFTRILSWGRDLKNALKYQIDNQIESMCLVKRVKKTKRKPPHEPYHP